MFSIMRLFLQAVVGCGCLATVTGFAVWYAFLATAYL